MVYESEGYAVKKIEAGKTSETKVTSIREGKLRDLVGNWEKFKAKMKQGDDVDGTEAAIKVTCENGVTVTIALPDGKECHPKSKMGMWLKTYGSAPAVGQAVKTMMDSNGYENIVLVN